MSEIKPPEPGSVSNSSTNAVSPNLTDTNPEASSKNPSKSAKPLSGLLGLIFFICICSGIWNSLFGVDSYGFQTKAREAINMRLLHDQAHWVDPVEFASTYWGAVGLDSKDWDKGMHFYFSASNAFGHSEPMVADVVGRKRDGKWEIRVLAIERSINGR